MKRITIKNGSLLLQSMAMFIFCCAILPAQAELLENNNDNVLPMADVKRFTTAIGHIKNYYVEKVEDKKLFEDAIRGMLEGLDPHSAYLNQEEFTELRSTTSGEFGGLGLEVGGEEGGAIKIVSPIDDSPAAKAGIKAGDFIIKINKTPVRGLPINDAVKMMRGEKGSKVQLTIIRKGDKEPRVFNIARDIIHVKSVRSKLLESGYGYVRVSMFQLPSGQDLNNAIKNLEKQNGGALKGMILDLRNNPGGLLDAAIDISDAFLNTQPKDPNDLIVFTKGRVPGSQMRAKVTVGDVLHSAPLIVLINEGSASASEIVAGALQDHKRAVIVGKRSFGKGSVQTILPLDDKTAIKITTARYYTPNGRSIQAKGIEPDVEIDNLVIPKDKSEKSIEAILSIKESDLQGHLKSEINAKEGRMSDSDKQDLLHTDYQLFQALNLLKGMVVMHQADAGAATTATAKVAPTAAVSK